MRFLRLIVHGATRTGRRRHCLNTRPALGGSGHRHSSLAQRRPPCACDVAPCLQAAPANGVQTCACLATCHNRGHAARVEGRVLSPQVEQRVDVILLPRLRVGDGGPGRRLGLPGRHGLARPGEVSVSLPTRRDSSERRHARQSMMPTRLVARRGVSCAGQHVAARGVTPARYCACAWPPRPPCGPAAPTAVVLPAVPAYSRARARRR